ncbi:hypothetical protein [Flavobacterium sp.]|uniref:hypothetical protein n=1 Tax=Flavobacterium sp. TaxID=239 RepID=UPI002BBD63FD|nr:hypothetical protein [Flavobacterium sp.]HSD06397.1 hypothetical protein [Flavobacterium sp.]
MRLKVKIIVLLICGAFGIGTMASLFIISENITHYHNSFIRRFPQHVAELVHQTDLIYNSYYFAGCGNGKIYLGNYTAPLQVMVLDSALQTKTIYHIKLKQRNVPFRGPEIRVLGDNFYVFEGMVPYVFKGSISNWTASLRINNGSRFSQLTPIDSVNMAVRYLSPINGENRIGTLHLGNKVQAKYNSSLLQSQFDGKFDTDGSLLYNSILNRIVYVYLYRNQYIVANTNLKLDYRGKTIDTVSHAQIQLTQLKNSNQKTFAVPPLIVNKLSAVQGKLLFVNSELPGMYETDATWKRASIIDVYDLTDKTYRSSFPIYKISAKKMKAMLVYENKLYALIDHEIVCYKLREYVTQNHPARVATK